jgi:hypothetical protein
MISVCLSAGPLPADLLQAIGAAQAHIRQLAAVLTGAAGGTGTPAHVGADVLAYVHHLARDYDHTRDPVEEHARNLARDLGYAHDLALAVARLAGAGTAADAAARALAHRLADALALAHRIEGDPERAIALARRLDRDGAMARRLVHDIANVTATAGRTCRRLVAAAVWVLPQAHQVRYALEFSAELWELSSLPRRRWRQLGYALRLTATCWSTRRAITGAPSKAAGPRWGG